MSKGAIQIPISIVVISTVIVGGGIVYIAINNTNNTVEETPTQNVEVMTDDLQSTSLDLVEETELDTVIETQKTKPEVLSNSAQTSQASATHESVTINTPSLNESSALPDNTIQESESQPAQLEQSEPTPTVTTETANESVSISEILIVPDLNSSRIEWNTNLPTDSKVFISGPNFSTKVFTSKSGYSTHHIADISNLTSGTEYIYTIEAINDNVTAEKSGSFSTLSDTFDITISSNVPAIPASGWHYAEITFRFTKNGQMSPGSIEITKPEGIQNYEISENNPNCKDRPYYIAKIGEIGGSCTLNTDIVIYYTSKSVGTKTFTAKVNGVSKSFDLYVEPYVEKKVTVALESAPAELKQGSNDRVAVRVSSPEEDLRPLLLGDIAWEIISDDFEKSDFALGVNSTPIQKGTDYVYINFASYPTTPGTFQLKIVSLSLKGAQSNNIKTLEGLPITTATITTGD